MTAATAPARIPCPIEGCGYSVEPGASTAGHVAMAHPETPMATVAPKRSARNRTVNGEELADRSPAAVPSGTGAALLLQIPLKLVDVGTNVRVDVAELDELTSSIQEHGVLQPVKVTETAGGRYRLVWGQRRTLAARQAGLATIPAIVETAGDVADDGATRSIEQLVENLHRADLNPIDRAQAMRAVVDSGVSQADLARKLGIAPSTVANDLRILTLDEKVIESVRSGELTASHAKAMASLPANHQRDLTSRITAHKLSAHQVESELQWRRQAAEGEVAKAERTAKQVPKLLALLEAEVAKGTAVHLQQVYNLDHDALQAAVKQAGWKGPKSYAYDEPAAGCDCTVVRVSFERTWKVTPACVNDGHRNQALAARRETDEAARKEYDERLAAIRDELERHLRAAELPLPVLRVLHAGIASYSSDFVVTMEDGPKAVAQELLRGWRVRELATPELLAELAASQGEAAKPAGSAS